MIIPEVRAFAYYSTDTTQHRYLHYREAAFVVFSSRPVLSVIQGNRTNGRFWVRDIG